MAYLETNFEEAKHFVKLKVFNIHVYFFEIKFWKLRFLPDLVFNRTRTSFSFHNDSSAILFEEEHRFLSPPSKKPLDKING